MQTFGVMMVIIVVAFYALLFTLGLVQYILQSLSFQSIARARNIQNSWLAWIPVASDWVLGKIAEKYDEENGSARHWGKTLLIFEIVIVAVFCVVYGFMVCFAVAMSIQTTMTSSSEPSGLMMIVFLISYVILIGTSLPAIAFAACKTVCIYKLFESIVPEKAVKYLVLSLMIPLAMPICLFKCKKKAEICSVEVMEENAVDVDIL